MKIQRRLWIYSCIIIAGLIIFFAYRYIGSRLWGLQFRWNSFLFFEQDRFMDFYKVNELVSSFNPYSNGSSSPPLALLFAYLFARIIPRTGTESAFALRDCSVIGRTCLYSLYAVCLLLIFIAVWKHMIPLIMCILLAISLVDLIYMRKKRTKPIATGKKKEMVVI